MEEIKKSNTGNKTLIAFATITTLFFAWGFITSNNDPLIASLKSIFDLSYTEALLTQFAFFIAYGLLSLPAAGLQNRIGAVNSILLALMVMVGGCLIMQGVGPLDAYWVILVGLFVLATGIIMLQIAANPLAAALGSPEKSHFRLTFAQAFNSLGVVLGVHYGSRLMLGDGIVTDATVLAANPDARGEAIAAVSRAFLLIGASLLALMAFIWALRARIAAAAAGIASGEHGSVFSALRARWALFGAMAIFLYVGAEVSIGSIMINFLQQQQILGLQPEEAGAWLANFYWGGALVGRFIGSFLLTRIKAPTLLTGAAIIAASLCAFVVFGSGPAAAFAALGVGFFNSIMFPTIFTITLERSGVSQSSTSGLLCVAIVGGALIPLLVGKAGDLHGLSPAFAIPALAYVGIAFFAAAAHKAKIHSLGGESGSPKIAH